MTATADRVRRFVSDRRTLFWGGIVNLEVAGLLLYFLAFDPVITEPRYLVYPFVWINVGVWAVTTTTPAETDRRHRRAAVAVGAGYFVVLAVVGGLISPGHALHGHAHATGLRIAVESFPPGWGPAVLYGGSYVTLAVLPFKVVGYLALAYLVYVTVLDAAGAALSGVVGLFSCVSCTWPVVGTVITGLFGGGSAVAAAAIAYSYDLSLLVFLSAVALLYYRPLR